jgi:hypothetical protein
MRRARPPVVSAILRLFLAACAFGAAQSACAGFSPPTKYEYAVWNNLSQYTNSTYKGPARAPTLPAGGVTPMKAM